MIAFLATIVLAATAVAGYAVPHDTPEVALAKAQHLAVVEKTKLRNLGAAHDAHSYGHGAHGGYAPVWNQWSAAPVVAHGHVQDAPDVADAKARHLSILAHEAARNSAPVHHYTHSAGDYWTGGASYGDYHHQWAPSEGYLKYGPAHIVVLDGQVQDTPEVAAAKSKHIAALHEVNYGHVHADYDELK